MHAEGCFFRRSTRAAERGAAAPLSAPFGYPKIFIRGNSIIFAYVGSFYVGFQDFSPASSEVQKGGGWNFPLSKMFCFPFFDIGTEQSKTFPFQKVLYFGNVPVAACSRILFFCCELAYEAGMPEDEWSCGCMLKDVFSDALHAWRRGGPRPPSPPLRVSQKFY